VSPTRLLVSLLVGGIDSSRLGVRPFYDADSQSEWWWWWWWPPRFTVIIIPRAAVRLGRGASQFACQHTERIVSSFAGPPSSGIGGIAHVRFVCPRPKAVPRIMARPTRLPFFLN
jgi:hypothetical protein